MDNLPEKISDGIYLIDTEYLDRKGYAASYIIIDNNEVAIIETNTNFAIPKILKGLQLLNIDKKQVKHIILTHIHLDHAGGAGLLMNKLPNAKLILHQRGERHMISPEKLIESVKYVYGEDEYKKMYGDILPIEKDKIYAVSEDENFYLGKRELYIFESLGHAKHHISIFDKKTKTLFTGDSFGIGYKNFKFDDEQIVFPSSSPTQFDPEKAIATINKSIELEPDNICLTHFGTIKNINSVAEQLKSWIHFLTKEGTQLYNSGLRENQLSEQLEKLIYSRFENIIREHRLTGLTEIEKALLEIDFKLNSQGVALYIKQNQINY